MSDWPDGVCLAWVEQNVCPVRLVDVGSWRVVLGGGEWEMRGGWWVLVLGCDGWWWLAVGVVRE